MCDYRRRVTTARTYTPPIIGGVVSITKLLVLPGEIKIYIFVTVKRMQKINMWLKSFYKLEICQSKIDLIHCSVIEFPMQDLPTSRLVVAAEVEVSHIKI